MSVGSRAGDPLDGQIAPVSAPPPNSAVGSPASADVGADVSGPPQYWPGEQLPAATVGESPLMATRRLATCSVVSVVELLARATVAPRATGTALDTVPVLSAVTWVTPTPAASSMVSV